LRLPPVPWCVNKEIVRVAMHGRLPTKILSRRKSPLSGDLAAAKAREGAVGPVDNFTPCPEFGRYVNTTVS
jgi:asparagine synthase (glutamine-hydrolysing)